MTLDTSGLTSYEPFAKWDHDSQSWRTSEATCLLALTLSSLTLPAWGGLHDGELFEHPTPALATSVLDCSSLPTPTRADYRTPPTNPGIRNGGSGVMPASEHSLPTKILGLLPTPKSAHGGAESVKKRPSGAKGSTNLEGALLPTPAVNDMGRGKTPEDWDAWTDKMKAAHGNGNGHGKSLEIEAARIGAITAPPSPDGNASSDDTHQHQLSLDVQAIPA